MALTQEQFDAAEALQTTINQIEDLLTIYPEAEPDPVTVAELTGVMNAINAAQANFTDARVMETINAVLLTCYQDIQTNLETLKTTIEGEFADIGEDLATITGFSAGAGDTLVNLVWDEHPIPDVIYKVQKAEESDYSDAVEIYSGTDLEFEAGGLTNDTLYYFRVRAEKAGYEDSAWATDSATPTAA